MNPDETSAGTVPPADAVAAPESTEEAAKLLKDSAATCVVVRGAGTKAEWGRPPADPDLVIETSALSGVVEHAAGDLIVIVRAGTRLGDIDLGDQILALDGPPGATVGGTVATATSGPRRLLYGAPRDLLIGVTVVLPGGTIAHAGGKVVKNVAGYDLGKLFTGSYGTLGLITECVFRLHPRPAVARWVRASVPPIAAADVRAARVAPTAVEYDSRSAELAVLIEGSIAGVRDRAETLAAVLDGRIAGEPPDWWDTYPWDGDLPIGLKLSVPLSKVPDLVATGSVLRGSPATGVLLGAAADRAEVDRLRAVCTAAGGHAIVLTAPAALRDGLDLWGPVPGLGLMRRVKDQFDPGHRFAPGSFVGGI